MALTLELVVSAVFASGTLRAYYELSALTPNPSPKLGRGELFIFSG